MSRQDARCAGRLRSGKLQPPAVRTVVQELVKLGQAAPDPPKQSATPTFLLYWRKPEEWGQIIYDWVSRKNSVTRSWDACRDGGDRAEMQIVENGMNGSILTLYEITEGDLSHTTEFYELPPQMLRRALDTLVKKGKAQLLKGEGEAGDGVRFL